ncbi:MAG: ATP-binding protein [Nitrospirae bacterium]|nr:ATP-binding protein [Nitrospirota bacterium]
MLVEFSVGNYLSFKNKVTLSMAAGTVKEYAEHIIPTIDPKVSLLKSAVIYGANASGKSNLIKSLKFMRDFVLESAGTQITQLIPVIKYLFSTESDKIPSVFEIVFIIKDVFYKYGFEVDSDKVRKEYLSAYPKKRERKYFNRDDAGIQVGKYFSEGKGLEKKTRPNSLFLSYCAQNNGAVSGGILKWFSKIDFLDNNNYDYNIGFALMLNDMLRDSNIKADVLKLLAITDLQIKDIVQEFIMNGKAYYFTTLHTKYNDKNMRVEDVKLGLEYESEGTKKIIKYSVPIIKKLLNGGILIIDDMNAMLHTIISKELVKLFNNNDKNAQFVITTHDTNLLDKRYFRRDQIWFTEKDQYGATDLYSLIEFKIDKKNDDYYERDYIKGRYGAIPFLVDFSKLFSED